MRGGGWRGKGRRGCDRVLGALEGLQFAMAAAAQLGSAKFVHGDDNGTCKPGQGSGDARIGRGHVAPSAWVKFGGAVRDDRHGSWTETMENPLDDKMQC